MSISETHRIIYSVSDGTGGFQQDVLQVGLPIPEGWTEVAPPQPVWKPVFDFEKKEWVETASEEEKMAINMGVPLEELVATMKERKKDELKRECKDAIEKGFVFEGALYTYENENQLNFQDTVRLFENEIVEEVKWNAYEDGQKVRKTFQKDLFMKLYLSGISWKESCLQRLNDELLPELEAAETVEEVQEIEWESEKADGVVLEENEKQRAKKEVVEKMIENYILREDLTEEEQELILAMFPAYEVGKEYKAGDRFKLNGTVYEVIQEHRSQEDWEPENTPALYKVFKKLQLDDVVVIEEWVQPTGAQDMYHKGDRVTHKGKVYESTADNNVWEPGVYGWEEVEG